jgi:hypothetical protein
MAGNRVQITQVPLFTEEQQFRQPWIWLIIVFSVLVGLVPLWYGLYQQLVQGEPWGSNPSPDNELLLVTVVTTVVILGVVVLFLKARLVVSVGTEAIEYRFIPFHRRIHSIPWTDVSKAFIRTYRQILEYGGWGIRFGVQGKAYNVSGNQGLQLELKSGKRILFGTQKGEELGAVLREIGRGIS